MTDEEKLLEKIQQKADEYASNFISKADVELIYTDTLKDGTKEHFVIGRDMPHLIFRIFKEDKAGEIEEIHDMDYITKRSGQYETEIKPSLKLVPPVVMETNDYSILVENNLEKGGVEIKLRSSSGRDITMVETFRYFDYTSKVFFVSCVSLSIGALYIFSLVGDGKILRLITNPGEASIKERIPMLTELFTANLLPSYQSIEVANKFLLNPNRDKPKIKLKDNNGQSEEFEGNFCYDDYESKTRFAFFSQVSKPEKGVVLIADIAEANKLTTSNEWTDEQRKAAERVMKLFESNKVEFNKHVCPFFVDNLDFRYDLFKKGKLKPNIPQPQEQKAEKKEDTKEDKKEKKEKKKK